MAAVPRFFQDYIKPGKIVPILFLSLILCPNPVASSLDPGNPLAGRLVEDWSSNRGLPSDLVSCLEQTPDGYLWIGTQRGLVRSDGLRHETLLHNPVIDLCAGKDGALWVCQSKALLRYQHGRFSPVFSKGGPLKVSANHVFEDMKGDLWIGSDAGRLGRLRDGVYTEFELPGNKEYSAVTAIKEDSRGTLWVGTMAGGLFKGREGVFSRWDPGRPAEYTVNRIREGRDGVLWIATNLGLVRIQDDQSQVLTQKDGLSIGYILDFLEDSEGNLWCATPQGLNLLRRDGEGAYRAAPATPPDQILDFLFEDREENLWISYPRLGLKCFKNVPFRTLAEESGIPSYSSAVFVSRDGAIWIGDSVGCLYRMENGRANEVLNLGYSPKATIMSMAEDSQGRLWFGTAHRGVFRVEAGKAVPFNAGRPLPFARTILPDSRGRIWVGFQDGLACIQDGTLRVYTTADGLPGDWVSSVLEDRAGRLWIATNAGLAVLKNGEWAPGGVETVLARNTIMTLFEDEDRVLWVGTYGGGLVRIRNGEITTCGPEQGLENGFIYQIQDDGAGSLWLNTPAGVIRVIKASWPDDPGRAGARVECRVYGKADGARGESANYSTGNSIARTRDGELWFALDDGISIVNPRRIKISRFLPTPVITRILFNHEEVPLDRNGAPFQGVRDVRFDFAAPSFISPERVRLRYRLEGVDSDWRQIEETGEKAAEYRKLRSGSYRFRVAACNSDGIWNAKDTVYDFSLKPYFHQTWPFKAGASVLALAIGLLAYLGLQRSLEQRKLKRKYRSSTLDSDKAEECARNLVHLFEQEKIFRSPDLSLASLSKRLGVSPKDLSRIINERLNRNFWALVNSYRIEEARGKIGNGMNGDRTILNVALEVGFNSLAAFNRAFKKFTGTTPSNYKKTKSQNKNNVQSQ